MSQMQSSVPVISVVICTYNRADLLANVLRTLDGQTLKSSDYEIIVIDNNSQDNTREVAEEFGRSHDNFYYHLETKQGLSYARNRGLHEARGTYVAYIDDDCKLPPQWLSVAKEISEHIAPSIFGGPARAFYDDPKPHWYRDTYGSYEVPGGAQFLTKHFVHGMNMLFRRSVLEKLGGFDPDYGMSGNSLGYAEEIIPQLLLRERMPDENIYYDPRLYVYHLVRPEQMTVGWIMRQRLAQGGCTYRAVYKGRYETISRLQLWSRSVKLLSRFVVDLFFGSLLRDRRQYPFYENYLAECTSQYLAHFSRLRAQYRISTGMA